MERKMEKPRYVLRYIAWLDRYVWHRLADEIEPALLKLVPKGNK